MKRFHIHVGVEDLQQSIRFYSSLFAADPTVRKPDYAKWMLDDPRVNFAISQRQSGSGIDHLGIQAEDADELAEVHGRLETAGGPILEEGQTTCCYAVSDKTWISDPQGIAWETFRTLGESTVYGGCGTAPEKSEQSRQQAACCGPGTAPDSSDQPRQQAACCGPAT